MPFVYLGDARTLFKLRTTAPSQKTSFTEFSKASDKQAYITSDLLTLWSPDQKNQVQRQAYTRKTSIGINLDRRWVRYFLCSDINILLRNNSCLFHLNICQHLAGKIKEAAEAKNDYAVLMNLLNDAVAAEVKYHKSCYLSYTRDAYRKPKSSK